MKNLFVYFIRRSFFVNLVSGFVLLVGFAALMNMKRDMIPPFQFKSIQVSAILPGAQPEEIEQFLTFPIQDILKDLPGLEDIASTSRSNESLITLRMKVPLAKMREVVSEIEARVNALKPRLPQSVRSITVKQDRVETVFLFWLGIEGFDEQSSEHRSFIQRFKERALRISGVAKVEPVMRGRNIHIQFKPELLRRFEISKSSVEQRIRQSFEIAPIGLATVSFEELSVEIQRSPKSPEELAELPIETNRAGNSLRLKDIAEVKWDLTPEVTKTWVNGKPGIGLEIQKSIDHDAIALKAKVSELINEFQGAAPAGVRLVNLVDGPYFVEQQIDVLLKNGLAGFALVLLILVLFLGFRPAIMTAIGLPIAYFGTLILLFLFGVDIDLISIVGMILVVGILVDDAIIVTEKYTQTLSEGATPEVAASESATRLFLPVTAGMLTTLIAFAPMLLIESEMSILLRGIPIVVLSALAISWVESFFILPNHLAHFVKKSQPAPADRFFSKVQNAYESFLNFILRWRYPLAGLSLGLFVLSGFLAATKLKHDFSLSVSAERLTLYMILKESASFEETQARTEKIAQELSEKLGSSVENVDFRVGRIWRNGQVYRGPRFATLNAYLRRDEKYPSTLKRQLQMEVEKYLDQVDRTEFEHLYSEIQRQGGDEEKGQLVSVEAKSTDELNFGQLETTMIDKIQSLKSIKEYVRDEERFRKTWKFHPNKEQLSLYGLDQVMLSRQLRSLFTPDEIFETRIGGEIVTIFSDSFRKGDLRFQDLAKLEVINGAGVLVPLRFFGQWQEVKTLKSLSHKNGERHLKFDFQIAEGEANVAVAKADMKAVVAEIQKEIPTVHFSVVDGDEQQGRNKSWALQVAVVCLIGVIFVIAILLGSLTQPLLVALPIPFGLSGIVMALYFHGLPMGLMALVGLVGTIGVSVNASIVMVDQINALAGAGAQGKPRWWNIIRGSSLRLRAVMLTTLTTLAGVFPMAYSLGGESGFTQPLAFAMGWGLGFAALGSLTMLPAFLAIREDFIGLGQRIFGRKKLAVVSGMDLDFIDDQHLSEETDLRDNKKNPPPIEFS